MTPARTTARGFPASITDAIVAASTTSSISASTMRPGFSVRRARQPPHHGGSEVGDVLAGQLHPAASDHHHQGRRGRSGEPVLELLQHEMNGRKCRQTGSLSTTGTATTSTSAVPEPDSVLEVSRCVPTRRSSRGTPLRAARTQHCDCDDELRLPTLSTIAMAEATANIIGADCAAAANTCRRIGTVAGLAQGGGGRIEYPMLRALNRVIWHASRPTRPTPLCYRRFNLDNPISRDPVAGPPDFEYLEIFHAYDSLSSLDLLKPWLRESIPTARNHSRH